MSQGRKRVPLISFKMSVQTYKVFFRFFMISFFFVEKANSAAELSCLRCICEIATDCVVWKCDPEKCDTIKENYNCVCGPFGITPPFWVEANSPSISSDGKTEIEKFRECVENFSCSIETVQYYYEKFAEDCNGDGVINCDDYALIHVYGNKGCFNKTLEIEKEMKYKKCMDKRISLLHHPVQKEPEETLVFSLNRTEDPKPSGRKTMDISENCWNCWCRIRISAKNQTLSRSFCNHLVLSELRRHDDFKSFEEITECERRDYTCLHQFVQEFVEKFGRDVTQDNVIDCTDFIVQNFDHQWYYRIQPEKLYSEINSCIKTQRNSRYSYV